eukprot:1150770-Pelagomonas_calceolata.AAC.4
MSVLGRGMQHHLQVPRVGSFCFGGARLCGPAGRRSSDMICVAEQVAEGARAREEEARTSGRELAERARKAEALVAEYEADIGQRVPAKVEPQVGKAGRGSQGARAPYPFAAAL